MRVLALLLLVLAPMVSAEDAHLPQKWVAEARLFDAVTGDPLTESRYASDVDHPFPDWGKCNDFLTNIGPVPARNGTYIAFRCRRLDAENEKQT